MHKSYTRDMETTHTVQQFFANLGFEPEIAAIYVTLYTHGPQTMSELARNSGVERTQVYRLLPTLSENNLVEIESEYKRNVVKASPIENLQILLARREQELQNLQDSLPLLERTLNQRMTSSPETKVQFYRGTEGVKQMFWNETKATTEVLSLLYENMQIKTNSKFFERWVAKCNQDDIKFRGIVSDDFLTSQKTWYDQHANERLANWQQRYVSPEVFKVSHSTVVYNNVVAHYNWNEAEVFGVEVYNQQIADTQRQFFELLWRTTQTAKTSA